MNFLELSCQDLVLVKTEKSKHIVPFEEKRKDKMQRFWMDTPNKETLVYPTHYLTLTLTPTLISNPNPNPNPDPNPNSNPKTVGCARMRSIFRSYANISGVWYSKNNILQQTSNYF